MIKKIKSFCKKNPYIVIGLIILVIYLLVKHVEQENFGWIRVNIRDGLIGHYIGDDSVNIGGKKWNDSSGKSNHATLEKGSAFSHGEFNGNKTLKGDTETGILFPEGILPPAYTIIYLSRYTSNDASRRKRIIQGRSNNWLTGHWGNRTAVAFHEGWMTSTDKKLGTNWVLGTDQNKYYRANNKLVEVANKGGGKHTRLTIGTSGKYNREKSDWEIAEILVYNRHLNDEEMKDVEGYLAHKYNYLKEHYSYVDKVAQRIKEEEEARKAEEERKAEEAAAAKDAEEARAIEEKEAEQAAEQAAADANPTEPVASSGGFCTIL